MHGRDEIISTTPSKFWFGACLLFVALLLAMSLASCASEFHRPENDDTTATSDREGRATGDGTPGEDTLTDTTTSRPLALIYRGPASCPGCSEAAAAMLRKSPRHFQVKFIGRDESIKLSAATLKSAAVYVQPGGNGTLAEAFSRIGGSSAIIRDYIRGGGRYLGICMGGYLAGSSPGFDLLPGDADQFITSPRARVTTDADTVIQVNWAGRSKWMYFQDGPYFKVDKSAGGVIVLATYSNGEIAALAAACGKGRVAVCGPHPEADARWYEMYGLKNPDGVDAAMGQELIEAVMR